MVAHADDLTRVLDHCGAEHAIVVGHSMGGFVVATMAVRHHERVQSIVLVDGGVRLLAPRTDDIDAVIEAVIGPAMRRLSMTFPTRTAYFDFWRAHPAFTGRFDAYVQAYAERDLVGEPPALRSACSLAAVRADGADTLQPDGAAEDWRVLRRPTAMLIAERGMLDQPQGLYPPGLTLPFPVRVIADVNHYTITLGDKGAAATADQILHMVRVSSSSDR
jgi:pimeloyl-ACP methyl ester carboxylesterase